ncbi:DNA-binding transcriptional response regulator [Rhizobium terrae]|uniref:transcriptional regulator n=1 Tax=Rhizobium terrae TaxID=2171756 RepID=UPI000E3CF89F|nr:transcriptional regulator [Rhizobium terrae]
MQSPSKHIVVIAPDLGLRQSLTFALEVEGYQVEAYETWRKCRHSALPALCMIIDDQVLRSSDARQCLRNSSHAVILLTDGISPPILENPGLTLMKPFDGAELLSLVRKLALTA